MSKDSERGQSMELERAPQVRAALLRRLMEMDRKNKKRWLAANAHFRRRRRLPDH